MYMCDVDECKVWVCICRYLNVICYTYLNLPTLHFPPTITITIPLSPSLLHIQWCTTTSNVPSSACHGRRTRLRADMLTSRVFVSKQTLIPSPRQLLWWGTIYQETRKRPMIRPLVLWWYIALKTVFIVNAMQETAHFQCKLRIQ